mgnify:CR=1 FL=1
MKLSTVFTINYVVAFLFGMAFVVLPAFSLSLMGLDSLGQAPLLARGWGVFILGVFVLTLFARDVQRSEGRKAIVISLFALYLLLDLYKLSLNLLYDVSTNWMFVLLYLIHTGFLVIYGYFLFGAPRELDA